MPSFYKINLFNRISEKKKIFVVFTHSNSSQRNDDFYKGVLNFDHQFIPAGSLLKRIIFVVLLLKKTTYKRIIIGGYDQIIYWFLSFYEKKQNNAVVVESSIFETKKDGIQRLLKILFYKRISLAYVSGQAQMDLCKFFKFNGKFKITKGVGLFNIRKQADFQKKDIVRNFIYVGRLSPEKNIDFLIDVFNDLPFLNLNIVGFGPQEEYLKSLASSNIIFHGAVDNSLLYEKYLCNDAFILPSKSEPWGMVVEEAFNNGLPVIVSNMVGCAPEIVNDSNGLIFDVKDTNSLKNCIIKMTDLNFHNSLRYNISMMDFNKVAEEQVDCYI